MELHQFSSQFIRGIETQMKLKCSQLVIDCQQQCIFIVNVSFSISNFVLNLYKYLFV
jgi:hypothetical protein